LDSLYFVGWYIRGKIFESNKPLGALGNIIGILISLMAVGVVFYASIRLNLSPSGKIVLLFGTFITAGFVSIFGDMISDGFSSILPKKKSDAIFYGIFLLALIVILAMVLKATLTR
jgi:hypothetical protein